MNQFLRFIKNIYRHREMIRVLAINDFHARYVGTLGGSIWTVLHPLATVFIFWFVFSVGFKAKGPSDMPFILYFVSGLLPWLTFNEVLLTCTDAIHAHAYLVKKTVFPSEILPIVYIVSAAISHAAFLVIVLVLFGIYGQWPTIYLLQLPYYLLALGFFCLGLGWFLAAVNAFFKDIGQTMTVVLNLWFWLTPIVWVDTMVPEQYRWLVNLNPVHYIVEGYRDSLIYHKPLWSNPPELLFFWGFALILFFIGATVFRKLKPEFADVL